MRAVPLLDEEKILSHIDSYEFYLSLCEEKKILLAKYKEVKKV